MAALPDPYRVLELNRGASLDEIKRAYRRLAKQHHPDSGGERALPRFLEIQAAYEQLVGTGPTKGRAPGPRPAPWQAEDVRADATRRAYGTRTRRTSGRAGGADAAGPGARGRGAGSAPPPGDAGTGGAAETGESRRERPPRRGRPPNKATMGSTTYDGVEDEPFEPGWTGASWYGTTSGTYWTLNPKEYADPRKHGPEYQARARRRRAAAAAAAGAGSEPLGDEDDSTTTEATGATAADGSPDATGEPGASPDTEAAAPSGMRADGPALDGEAPGEPAAAGETAPAGATPRADDRQGADDPPRAGEPPPAGRPGWTATPRTSPGASWWAAPGPSPRRPSERATDWGSDGRDPGDRRRGHGTTTAPDLDPFDPGAAVAGLTAMLSRNPTRPLSRLALALAGGAPLALGLAWLLGEITGCGRFSAACDPGVISFAWLAGAVIIAGFVLAPALAAIATAGTIVSFAAGIPATVLLTATGGARMPQASSAVLAAILVAGWLVGVAYAATRRRTGSARGGPVS